MDRQEAMSVFLSVVDEGDFSAAARGLRMTPSAVSKIVARLESRLGVRLLQRSTRRIGLTTEGTAYAEAARRILAEIAEAEDAIRPGAEPRGRLRISLPSAFGHRLVVPLLPEFIVRYPAVALDLSFNDAIVDLVGEGIDVAIRVAQHMDSRLIVRRLAANRRVISASPAYVERHGAPQAPEELRDHVCLGISAQGGLNLWEFDGPDGPRTMRIRSRIEADSTEALRRLALAGVGIIRMSEILVGRDIRAGRLVPLLTGFNHPDGAPICAVYPSKRLLSPNVRVFVDYLAERFADPPWQRDVTIAETEASSRRS
jgi:DNA-binding transcriptional LysR family regulator